MSQKLDLKITDGRGRSLTIGTLRKEGDKKYFHKKVTRAKHLMRMFSAYGIQKEAFDKYLRGKDITIVIEEEDTKDTLLSEVKDWEEHASYQNYGHGRQMFLSTKYMKKWEGEDETN